MQLVCILCVSFDIIKYSDFTYVVFVVLFYFPTRDVIFPSADELFSPFCVVWLISFVIL